VIEYRLRLSEAVDRCGQSDFGWWNLKEEIVFLSLAIIYGKFVCKFECIHDSIY